MKTKPNTNPTFKANSTFNIGSNPNTSASANENTNPNTLNALKTKGLAILQNKNLHLTLIFATLALFSFESFASPSAAPDAFATIYTKIADWTTGTAGKLITLISLLFGALGGVLGFNTRVVFGAIGVGLILASANTIVGMFFA